MKRTFRKLLSVLLVITLCISAMPVFSSAAGNEPGLIKRTLPVYGMNQLYARGLMVAGIGLSKIAEASSSETFQKGVAFVNKFILGNNTTAKDLAEIKEMCSQIISDLDAIDSHLNGIEQTLANDEIKAAYENIGISWEADVKNPIDNASVNILSNALQAYRNYLLCAYSYKYNEEINITDQSGGKVLKVADESLVNYWDSRVYSYLKRMSGATYKFDPANPISEEDFYDAAIYNSNSIDNTLSSLLDTLTTNLSSDNGGINTHDRYIDRAAQFAYMNYTYADEQAEFVQLAVKNQVFQIFTVVMFYQEFIGRRAEYFDELYNATAQIVSDKAELEKYYNNLNAFYIRSESELNNFVCGTENAPGLVGKINSWLDSKIYLQNAIDSTYIYYDSCMAILACAESDYVVLSNKNYYTDLGYDFYFEESNSGRIDGYLASIVNSSKITEIKKGLDTANREHMSNYDSDLHFYKKTLIKANSAGEANFVPVMFLDHTEAGLLSDTFLRRLNMPWTAGNDDYFFPKADYYNLVRSTYTDGVNTFSAVKDGAEIKSLVGSVKYRAADSVLCNFFGEYVGYSGSNAIYLLTAEDTTGSSVGIFNHEVDTSIKGVDLKDSVAYSDNWISDELSLKQTQRGESLYNSMYAVMLVARDLKVHSRLDYKVVESGSATVKISGTAVDGASVYDSANHTAIAGASARIDITPDSYSKIKKVTVQYHCDADALEEITSEDVLYDSSASNLQYAVDENGVLSFEYPVSYTNATILVETENKGFETDENGNFIISNYNELMRMAQHVNSGEKMYVTGSYVITADIQCGDNWEPIGQNEGGFQGVLKGNDFVISGLNKESANRDKYGLFKIVGKDAHITNIVVEDVALGGLAVRSNVGVITAENSGTIEKCMVLNADIPDCVRYSGGIAGYNTSTGEIKGCGVLNSSFTGNPGGIAGNNEGEIDSCYVYDCLMKGESCGDLINAGTAPINSYFYTDGGFKHQYGTKLSAEEFASGRGAYLLNNGVNGDATYWVQNIDNGNPRDSYPVNKRSGDNFVFKISDDVTGYSNYPASGKELNKDEEGRYLIYNYDDLQLMSTLVNSGLDVYVNATYVLMDEIDCGRGEWCPMGTTNQPFCGVLVGNGHKLKNLMVYDSSYANVGLFAYVGKTGVVKDVVLADVDFCTGVSAIVGGVAAYNAGTVENCSVSGEIATRKWQEGAGYTSAVAGGIVGSNRGTVKNCSNTARLTFTNTSIISNVICGGVAGSNNGIIEKSYNAGNIVTTALRAEIAGIVGYNGYSSAEYAINNCYNTGRINAAKPARGSVDIEFVNRYLEENGYEIRVDSYDDLMKILDDEAKIYVGGVVAETNKAVIKNTYSAANIGSEFKGKVGGLCGSSSNGEFVNSYYVVDDAMQQTDASMKYRRQFTSGEVAYLLEKGNTESVWGQKSNTAGSLPEFTDNELYKVSKTENGVYSVAGVGDVNGDGIIDVTDYQQMVNIVTSSDNDISAFEDALSFTRTDLNGDGYIDVLDAAEMNLLVNRGRYIGVYKPGDFDGDGIASTDDAEKIRNVYEGSPITSKGQYFACDLNGNGKLDDVN